MDIHASKQKDRVRNLKEKLRRRGSRSLREAVKGKREQDRKAEWPSVSVRIIKKGLRGFRGC